MRVLSGGISCSRIVVAGRLLVTAVVAWPLTLGAQGYSVDTLLQQGQRQLDARDYPGAIATYERILSLPGGQRFGAFFGAAQAYFGATMIEPCVAMVQQSYATASSPQERRQVTEFSRLIDSFFGRVRIRVNPASTAVQGTLTIQPQAPPADPMLAGFIDNTIRFWGAQPAVDNTVVYLPAGRYAINGTPVAVTAGSEVALQLTFMAPAPQQPAPVGVAPAPVAETGAPPAAATTVAPAERERPWYKNPWLWVGVGAAVVVAGGVATYMLLSGGDEGGEGASQPAEGAAGTVQLGKIRLFGD